MKNLHTIGINHKTAPIEVREQFFLNDTQQDLFLSDLKNQAAILEAFVLSTCNRTEVYLRCLEGMEPLELILSIFAKIKKIKNINSYRKYFYFYLSEKAVKHLLRVTTGLDSLVLGEKQILGQVKSSLKKGKEQGMFSRHFNLLSNLALRTGKKVYSETQVSFGGSSISWAALAKAERVLGSLESKSILIIGAGKMGGLAIEQIHKKGISKIYLMNRSEDKAHLLAQKYNAQVSNFCDIKEILTEVDICICAAGAPHYVLEKSTITKIMALRKDKSLLLIDISMPRNIDPKTSQVDNVHLFAIDDLNEVVDANMQIRLNAKRDVEDIINNKLKEYSKKIHTVTHSHCA